MMSTVLWQVSRAHKFSKGRTVSCSLKCPAVPRKPLAFCGHFSMRGSPLFTLTRAGRALRNATAAPLENMADEALRHQSHDQQGASPAPSRAALLAASNTLSHRVVGYCR